ENWGAITYREVYLLYDEQATSTSYKKFMAMIIAHEIWHQWSGDLVTMKWWNDLWLNESFATYMAYKAVDHLFPEWKMWEEFARGETIRAMEDDSLKATHPIECEVKDVREIEQLFDAISYAKGANVLRMIEDYMGKEDFMKGVADYLEANKYGNATSEDLWRALERASGKEMREMVKSWIRQHGFPVVDVEMRGNVLTLKQRRFLAGKATNALWKIPITMNADGAERKELLSTKAKNIQLNARWLKANYGQAGFYRVRYGKENLSALERKIMDKTLPVADRWGLLDDMFKLSLNGFTALEDYMDFMKNYENEDSYLVLATVAGSLRAVHFAFCDEPFWGRIWPRFREHMKKPFLKSLQKLSWSPRSGENKEDALMRELAISFLNFCEDVDTIGKGLQLFARYASGSPVHPDMRGSLLAIAASSGTERMNATLLDMYKNAGNTEEKVAILSALGQFRNVKILEGNMDFALSDSVRYQDVNYVIASASSNLSSRKIFIPWLERNWSAFEKRKNSGPTFLRAIEYIISAHPGREKDIDKFFAAHPVDYKAIQKRAFEKLSRTSSWVKKNRTGLEHYFGKECE
ncbi:MAG: M1 family metallopeptidase, partial [Candidatus Aenigmarchaeota archaeon]|nr:M1 family metallopeptidase [Candidatus Aenigmarchaeota archaeon]